MKAIFNTKLLIFLHIAAWALVFTSPFVMVRDMEQGGIKLNYFVSFFLYIFFLVVFYFNYFLLIPKLLFKSKYTLFVILNVCLISVSTYSSFYVHTHADHPLPPKKEMVQNKGNEVMDVKKEMKDGHHRRHVGPAFGLMHDVSLLFLVAVISILVRFTMRWFSSIEERRMLEQSKTEMELKNLKNQLNPHFLFNTLNNIYALIGISQDKAQQAVLDLSKLLRYVLYDGQQPFVPISQEVDFIQNYVKLMKLRLSNSVSVTSNFNLGENSNLQIAQLLFISLVENAFKHGVSLTQPSFIDMSLTVDNNKQVNFIIKNSYFPKTKNDKSGSGIGIDNLKRRLDLLYPESYTYSAAIEDNTYTAKLILNL